MKIENKRQKTALASARISTAKQVTGESLDEQISVIKKYASANNIKILPDGEPDAEVFSGAKRRPVYENHIKYIKDNPNTVDYYIIRYIDRFTRGGITSYESMKQELADLGVKLIDTNGIIQPYKNMPELEELGFEYPWSIESPSTMTETMMAIQGEQERKRILQRTIPKQIKYTRKGFHIGNYDDGYIGKKIHTGDQIRFIQVPDLERSQFIIKIFELRSESRLTDEEILDYINNKMGYRSKIKNRWNPEKTKVIGKRGGKKLTLKQMHRILRRTTYAGIICEKWTENLPVKAQYEGLVSIEVFNQANRGKIFIKEEDEKISLLYDHKTEKKVYKRLKYNPEFPFKCVRCPHCKKQLKGSSSRGKSGKYFPAYHCARSHKRFSVSKDTMHNQIEDFFAGLNYTEKYIEILKEVVTKKFELYIKNFDIEKETLKERILLLEEQQAQIIDKYILTDNPLIKQKLDDKVSEIEKDLNNIQSKAISININKDDLGDLLKFTRKIVEHPQKVLIDKENPLRQEKLLTLVFDGFPTYEELNSGTPKLSFVFMAEKGKSTSKTSTSSQLGCHLVMER